MRAVLPEIGPGFAPPRTPSPLVRGRLPRAERCRSAPTASPALRKWRAFRIAIAAAYRQAALMRAAASSEFESLLFNEAQQVAAEFFRIEAHAEILHAQDAALIDDRGEEGVIDAAVCGLGCEYAVAARHVADGAGRPREECPAGKIGAKALGISFGPFGGVGS